MLVNEQVVLTDLPGLPSRDHQVADMWEKSWRPLVVQYLRQCESLRCMVYVHDVRWKVTSYVREFVREVAALDVPILLVLSKDDRILGELHHKERETAEAERQAEIALRERLMLRVRRALDFDGVHLHYSTDNTIPASRKARRNLLRCDATLLALPVSCAQATGAVLLTRVACPACRYVESLVGAGTRDECRELLSSVEQRGRPGARD